MMRWDKWLTRRTDNYVGNFGGTLLMFDFMLFLVELTLPQQVIDRFIVLGGSQRQ